MPFLNFYRIITKTKGGWHLTAQMAERQKRTAACRAVD